VEGETERGRVLIEKERQRAWERGEGGRVESQTKTKVSWLFLWPTSSVCKIGLGAFYSRTKNENDDRSRICPWPQF